MAEDIHGYCSCLIERILVNYQFQMLNFKKVNPEMVAKKMKAMKDNKITGNGYMLHNIFRSDCAPTSSFCWVHPHYCKSVHHSTGLNHIRVPTIGCTTSHVLAIVKQMQ